MTFLTKLYHVDTLFSVVVLLSFLGGLGIKRIFSWTDIQGMSFSMEKHKAHYSLALVHHLVDNDQYRFTRTARHNIRFELGMKLEDAIAVILDLKPADLYKSMTTHYEHTLWQDVYHSQWEDVPLYIKLQVDDEADVVIISFKRLEE